MKIFEALSTRTESARCFYDLTAEGAEGATYARLRANYPLGTWLSLNSRRNEFRMLSQFQTRIEKNLAK